jgi:hypothetical protein
VFTAAGPANRVAAGMEAGGRSGEATDTGADGVRSAARTVAGVGCGVETGETGGGGTSAAADGS